MTRDNIGQITGVALLGEDGRMWALPRPARHFHLFALAAFQGTTPDPCEQGFVTAEGVFFNRKQAAEIALECGQVDALNSDELFSEDVW